MARQPNYELWLRLASLSAATSGGRAFLLASPELYPLPGLGEQRLQR